MSERRTLFLSALACLLTALLAAGFSLTSGSQAVLLDGAINLLFFGVGLLTLRVQRLVAQPSSNRFPYGYAAFEPLLNAAKGLLIFAVSAMAIVPSMIALFSGGRVVDAGLGAIYGGVAMTVGVSMAVISRRVGRATGSPLVLADSKNWLANALVSMAVTLAFLSVQFAESAGLHAAVPYLDPAVVSAVVLLTLPVPIGLVRDGVNQLLLRGPDAAVQKALVDAAVASVPGDAEARVDVRTARLGRKNLVSVCCLVGVDEEPLLIRDLDEVRQAIADNIRAEDPSAVVEVTFTTRSQWMSERVSQLAEDAA